MAVFCIRPALQRPSMKGEVRRDVFQTLAAPSFLFRSFVDGHIPLPVGASFTDRQAGPETGRTDRQVQKPDGPGNSWPLRHGEAAAAAVAAPAVGG